MVAQTPPALHVSVTPSKAGTEAKPRAAKPLRPLSSLELSIERTKGAASLFATRGCPLPFKVKAGARILTAAARCR